MDDQTICRWLECPHEALSQGHLCAEHLTVVLKGQATLPRLSRDLVAGVGIGLTADLLVKALEATPQLLSLLLSGATRSGLLEVEHSPEDIVRQSLSIAAGRPVEEEAIRRRLVRILGDADE